MTDADRNRLLLTLAGVYAYHERELTEFAISVWLEDLAGFPIEAVERAFVAHRRDPQRGQWLPKSADVLRHLQPADGERAALAWAALLAEVRACGSYRSPQLEGMTRLALDSLGGWAALCNAQERELPHLQRRFVDAFGVYEARSARGENDVPGLTAVAQALRLQ